MLNPPRYSLWALALKSFIDAFYVILYDVLNMYSMASLISGVERTFDGS